MNRPPMPSSPPLWILVGQFSVIAAVYGCRKVTMLIGGRVVKPIL